MRERRRIKRFSTRLKVFLQESDELLGYADNVSQEGMMVMTEKPIPDNMELELWFGADKEEKRTHRIFVSAYKVWDSFTEDEKRFYYTGLQFIAPSETIRQQILTLLKVLND